MNVRPHAFLHMIAWYFGSSVVITVLYLIMMSGFFGFSGLSFRDMIAIGGTFAFAMGVPLGYIAGLVINYYTHTIKAPYTEEDARNHTSPQVALFAFPMLFVFFVAVSITGGAIGGASDGFLYALFPTILSGLFSAFAARRFLHRMTIWSANEMQRKSKEKAKNKAKNASRLLDKEKNEDIFTDEPRPQRRSRRKS